MCFQGTFEAKTLPADRAIESFLKLFVNEGVFALVGPADSFACLFRQLTEDQISEIVQFILCEILRIVFGAAKIFRYYVSFAEFFGAD